MTGTWDNDPGLQRLLDDIGDDAGAVGRLCHTCVEQIPVDGAGLSMVTDAGERTFVFATDDVSAQIEELQVSHGEGPCVDAWTARRPVLEADLMLLRDGRWPGFAPAAIAAGAAAVFSLPLQVGRTHLGALDMYRVGSGSLTEAELHGALRLGEAATRLLLRMTPSVWDPLSQQDGDGRAHGLEVFQATGMVMAQLELSAPDAMARLRAHAYLVDRPLREIARDIVARRLRLDRDQ